MARCGIELEALIATFPKFLADVIAEIYQEIHKHQYLVMDVNNAVFPYLLQPWVVVALNKHNDLRDSFKNSFELVSAQLYRQGSIYE